jgi:hypothetical protein
MLLHGAPLAQLDRASGYEPEGREFESLRARHFESLPLIGLRYFLCFVCDCVLWTTHFWFDSSANLCAADRT